MYISVCLNVSILSILTFISCQKLKFGHGHDSMLLYCVGDWRYPHAGPRPGRGIGPSMGPMSKGPSTVHGMINIVNLSILYFDSKIGGLSWYVTYVTFKFFFFPKIRSQNQLLIFIIFTTQFLWLKYCSKIQAQLVGLITLKFFCPLKNWDKNKTYQLKPEMSKYCPYMTIYDHWLCNGYVYCNVLQYCTKYCCIVLLTTSRRLLIKLNTPLTNKKCCLQQWK